MQVLKSKAYMYVEVPLKHVEVVRSHVLSVTKSRQLLSTVGHMYDEYTYVYVQCTLVYMSRPHC